jgi:hypothetical protein
MYSCYIEMKLKRILTHIIRRHVQKSAAFVGNTLSKGTRYHYIYLLHAE